jgi:hypothetical protein
MVPGNFALGTTVFPDRRNLGIGKFRLRVRLTPHDSAVANLVLLILGVGGPPQIVLAIVLTVSVPMRCMVRRGGSRAVECLAH